jgi:hypothetical protein
MLGSTARPATCAYEPRLRSRNPLVSSCQSLSLNTLGMSQVSISLSSSLIHMGFNTTMIVVDLVTKQGHFIPTHTTVTALGSTWLYLQHIWKLHGLPKFMISNHGPQFVTDFMCKLYRVLDIKVSASTTYHPQSDGQTKHVNQEFKQYIHIFINKHQDNWDTLLPLAKFTYNNHTHSATQHTPFFVDTGRHP